MRYLAMAFCMASFANAQTVTFENLTLAPNSNVNGTPFANGGVSFTAAPFEGFSYSNIKDITTPGFVNQYAAYMTPLPADPLGAGFGGSANYGIGYDPGAFGTTPTMTFPAGTKPVSLQITNNTYAALSMRDGDGFAKKFGGPTGNDPDFLRLTIQGFDNNNLPTGSSEFFLADYRFSNNSLDYIVKEWTSVPIAFSDDTRQLKFTLDSTDNGPFGMNTPAYFAVDQIQFSAVPEPTVAAGVLLLLTVARRVRR